MSQLVSGSRYPSRKARASGLKSARGGGREAVKGLVESGQSQGGVEGVKQTEVIQRGRKRTRVGEKKDHA